MATWRWPTTPRKSAHCHQANTATAPLSCDSLFAFLCVVTPKIVLLFPFKSILSQKLPHRRPNLDAPPRKRVVVAQADSAQCQILSAFGPTRAIKLVPNHWMSRL